MAWAFSAYSGWTERQTWAVIFTAVVLIWYTWETMEVRRAAHLQRELQLRPFIVLEPQERDFVLSNVGNGAAVNIKIDDVVVDETHGVSIRFPASVPVLRPGAALPIRAESIKGGKSAGDFFLAHLDPQYAALELKIVLRFQNVEMKPYSVAQTVCPGELRITGFEG
jgi:hypothetical protein